MSYWHRLSEAVMQGTASEWLLRCKSSNYDRDIYTYVSNKNVDKIKCLSNGSQITVGEDDRK